MIVSALHPLFRGLSVHYILFQWMIYSTVIYCFIGWLVMYFYPQKLLVVHYFLPLDDCQCITSFSGWFTVNYSLIGCLAVHYIHKKNYWQWITPLLDDWQCITPSLDVMQALLLPWIIGSEVNPSLDNWEGITASLDVRRCIASFI